MARKQGTKARLIINIPALIAVALIIGGLVYYFGYSGRADVKLAPPAELPFFSVSYTYVYSGQPQIDQIKDDLKDIADTGFNGIKLGFYFTENNYSANTVACMAAKEGLYPIGILNGHNAKSKDRAFSEEELNRWEEFTRETVKANKDIIYFWEIWNEPAMVELFRYGTPQEFIVLLQRTSKIIREENPEAKIVVTLDETDREAGYFTNQALSLGAGNYFDILSFHPYTADPYIQEDIFKSKIEEQKQLLARYGNRWPLWITEIGQPVSEVSEAKQAQLAGMVFSEAVKQNIPVVWLHYTDQRIPAGAVIGGQSGWGLVREDGSKRPAYDEIRRVINEK